MTTVLDFANRVRKSARHWGKWARRRGIHCYRVYDRDIPEFALALDVYGEYAHLQEYERSSAEDDAGRAEWRDEVHRAAAESLDIPLARVVMKRRARRHAGEQHEKTGESGHELVVEEGAHRFIVNLEAYLDTGLFLDHRNTRALVQAEAKGRRFLNLFSYTGSFTVYAAAGGATDSISVDLSNTYLDWARRNFALNRIDVQRHRLVRADVLQWLGEARRGGERFDLIVLDPPSVSKSKAMVHALDVQQDHPALIEACARLLSRRGVLYFSTNLQRFRPAPEAFEGLEADEISERTVPEDFRNRKIHRCWRAVRDEG